MLKVIFLSKQLGAGAGMFKKGVRSIIGEGKVLKKLSSKTTDLPEELVNFLNGLRRGDVSKPLARDTVFVTPLNRGELSLDIPINKHGGYRVTLERNPLVLEDGTKCSEPLSIKGFKDAIKGMFLSRKRDAAILSYCQNPTSANKDAYLKLFPDELKNNAESVLKSRLKKFSKDPKYFMMMA